MDQVFGILNATIIQKVMIELMVNLFILQIYIFLL